MYPDEIDFVGIDEKEPLIDLHGLHVKEAIEYAKLAMKAAKTKSKREKSSIS